MGASGNSIAIKSFQSFTVSEGLLAKVVEAVKAGEKEAHTSGDIKSFEVFYKGFRQNIAIGRIYIVPAKVCADRKNFPIALLYGTVVREFNLGEEVADLITNKIGDTEFDEYSQADFQAIKDKLFYDTAAEEYKSLVLFAPHWANTRDYVYFKYTSDDAKLANLIRHLIFAAYFNPSLSSAFDALMTTVDTHKFDVTDITPKLTYPFLSENPLKAFPELNKVANSKKKVFLTKKTADEITKEVLDPQELNVFEALDTALEHAMMPETTPIEEAAEPDYKEPHAQAEIPTIEVSENAKEASKEDRHKKNEDGSHATDCPWCAAFERDLRPEPKEKKSSEEESKCEKCGAAHEHHHKGYVSEFCKKCCPDCKKKASLDKWAKVAGQEHKTANIKLTFGTNNVYFDFGGKKYMLEGEAAEQFINEWLPIYSNLKAEMEAEKNKLVELLTRKYMKRMVQRPANTKKAPLPPAEESAMGATASEKKAFEDEEFEEAPLCPMCDTPGNYMGALGRLQHFRCPACGMDFSQKVAKVTKKAATDHDLAATAMGSLDEFFSKEDMPRELIEHAMHTLRGATDPTLKAALKDIQNALLTPDFEDSLDWLDNARGKLTGYLDGNTIKAANARTIARDLARQADDTRVAMSTKAKAAQAKREAHLDKLRSKKADVPLSFEEIWNEVTEDFGEAPEVPLPGEGSESTGEFGGKSKMFEKKWETKNQPEEKSEEKSEPKAEEKSEEVSDKSKEASDVSSDVSEAKAEVVSPDTVDPDIKQETKSVPEAAKVAGSHKHECPECGEKLTCNNPKDCPGEGKKALCGSCPKSKTAMLFMNEMEIEEATRMFANDPVLGPATRFLNEFKDEVNSHSDGWPYWSAPVKAAAQLMTLIQKGIENKRGFNSIPVEITPQMVAKAMAPIKAFMTRRGAAAGMTMPKLGSEISPDINEAKSELDAGAKKELADNPEATATVNPEHFAATEALGDTMDEEVEMELGMGDLADLAANLPEIVGKSANEK